GASRSASVVLPSWYGPMRHPAVPLVISPHGRGGDGRENARLWGNLPALGSFAVVNPDGEGSHLSGRFSWGAPGQIDDLARLAQPDRVRACDRLLVRAVPALVEPHGSDRGRLEAPVRAPVRAPRRARRPGAGGRVRRHVAAHERDEAEDAAADDACPARTSA